MKIIKNGTGIAKHYADLAEIEFSLMTKSKDKDALLDKYLLDYETTNSRINEWLKENNFSEKLYFDNYTSSESKKQVEVEKDGVKETQYITDFYYIRGSFYLDLPIKDNNWEPIAKLIALVDTLCKQGVNISCEVEFTLQEETKAQTKAQATNNALDNIYVEIKDIARHIGKTNIELESIDFVNLQGSNDSFMYETSISRNASFTEEQKIELLDKMLESDDIEITSTFKSIWEVN